MVFRVVDLDLASAREDIALGEHDGAWILVRWRKTPLGNLWLRGRDGRVSLREVWRAAAVELGPALPRTACRDLVGDPPAAPSKLPPCTVIVCTRDRPEQLARCLQSLQAAAAGSADIEIVVVDSASSDDRTARVAAGFSVRLVTETRPGLNRARRGGARAARHDLVLYTDDDAVIDRGWIDAMRAPFALPHVGAVTGLVLPYELETEAQAMFEEHAGFGRGYGVRAFSAATVPPVAAGTAGAGASMAFRRHLIADLGLFDAALDAGTPARSGGDHYAFYLLLREGHTIVYDPKAIVWHQHRRSHDGLCATLHAYSVGTFAYLLHCVVRHADVRALYAAARYFVAHHLCNLGLGLLRRPGTQPLRLTLAEIRGAFAAPFAYVSSNARGFGA